MKSFLLLTSTILLATLAPSPAALVEVGPGFGNSQYSNPDATDVGQLIVFPNPGTGGNWLLNDITFWAHGNGTVNFTIYQCNGPTDLPNYWSWDEAYSGSHTFSGGTAFERVSFLTGLNLHVGYYYVASFGGLRPENGFVINSWSTDAYSSQWVDQGSVIAGNDWHASLMYRSSGKWNFTGVDAGFDSSVLTPAGYNPGPGAGYMLTGSSPLPAPVVPEPSTWLAGLLLLGMMVVTGKKHWLCSKWRKAGKATP